MWYMVSMEKTYSPEEVAEHEQLNPYTVRKMLREGQFKGAYQIGRKWRIPETSITTWREERAAETAARHRERAG